MTRQSPSASDSTTVDRSAPSNSESAETLRREISRSNGGVLDQQSQYRRAGFAVLTVSILIGILGMMYPDVRSVLTAIAGSGIVISILIFYTVTEQFVPASVVEGTYATLVDSIERTLGWPESELNYHYIPIEQGPNEASVALIVTVEPTAMATGVESDSISNESITKWQFRPTGGALFAAFDRELTEELSPHPEVLLDQLTSAVTDMFELTNQVPVLVLNTDRLVVRIEENAYGPADQFDHPIVSFLAVGLAIGLDSIVSINREPRPIGYEVTFIIHNP